MEKGKALASPNYFNIQQFKTFIIAIRLFIETFLIKVEQFEKRRKKGF